MNGKKTAAKTSKTKAVKKGKKTAAKTSKTKAVKKGMKTTAKARKTNAVKKRKRAKKAKTAADATFVHESSAPPEVTIAAEPRYAGTISEQLVSKILDREEEQRRMLWQMAEDISRLGAAIQHQHHMLTDLIQHILQQPDRQLHSSARADEPPQAASPAAPSSASAQSVPPNESVATKADADAALVLQEELQQLRDALAQEQELVDRLRRREAEDKSAAKEADTDAALVSQEELRQLQDALVRERELVERLRRSTPEIESAATEADADAKLVPQHELLQLRDALAEKEALVERLRRSKLEIERRAVAAEVELDKTSPANRKGIWTRLLGRHGEK